MFISSLQVSKDGLPVAFSSPSWTSLAPSACFHRSIPLRNLQLHVPPCYLAVAVMKPLFDWLWRVIKITHYCCMGNYNLCSVLSMHFLSKSFLGFWFRDLTLSRNFFFFKPYLKFRNATSKLMLSHPFKVWKPQSFSVFMVLLPLLCMF